MATLSIEQFKALSFGYLTGENLKQFSPPSLLIGQYNVDSESLANGVSLAYSELIGQLSRKYNVQTELDKVAFIPASLAAVVTAGVVTSVTIVSSGIAYTVAPTIEFGGPGSAATATATINAKGQITAVSVTNGGTGYTSAPSITLSGGVPTDTRSQLCVKIVSILAVRNILGSSQSISDMMLNLFKWADTTLKDIRNGQMNLPLNIPALPDPTNEATSIDSVAKLVNNSFLTIG